MKAAASILLALFALSGSLGVRAPLGPCGALAVSCKAKPCCKPPTRDTPSVRARMACCEVTRAVEQQPAPALAHEQLADAVVAVRTIPQRTWSSRRVPERVTPLVSPRGLPLYLRNRSLLL